MQMKVVGKEGYYGIIHKDGKALIWPTLDCSLPPLNQRNIGWAIDVGRPIEVPEGWTIEYVQGLDLGRFSKWTFVININVQKSWILRSTFGLGDEYRQMDQFSEEGVNTCLDMIPSVIIAGSGTIVLEDSLEWVLVPRRVMIARCVAMRGLTDRVRYLSPFQLLDEDLYANDIFMDTFESQTMFDLYGNEQTPSDYDDDVNMGDKLLCLNRRCDSHRVMTTKEFIDRDLMDSSYFTYTNEDADCFLDDSELLKDYMEYKNLTLDEIKAIPNMRLDEVFNQVDGWPRNGFTPELKECYKNSKYYIITETLNYQWKPHIFVTEKTFRTFLYKTPFIMIANTGLLEYLKGQGYKVVFDGIGKMYNDHHDDIPDLTQFNMTMNLIERAKDMTPSALDNQRCIFNFKHWNQRAMPRMWEQVLDLVDA